MRYQEIQAALSVLHAYPGARRRAGAGIIEDANQGFVPKYIDLETGWFIAREFATLRAPIPVVLEDGDRWIFRAYAHMLGQYDPAVAEANAIATEPALRGIANLLRALLICKDAQAVDIAKRTGVRVDVLLAFEKLFYNVLDRHADSAYIATMVYPETRMREIYEDYVESETWGALLVRVGFNRGTEAVALLAGLVSSSVLRSGEGAALADQLEATIMANALMVVHAGFVHQEKHSVAINHARSILIGAKQGGQDTAAGSPISSSTGDELTGQMTTFFDAEKRLRSAKRAARLTVEVEASADG